MSWYVALFLCVTGFCSAVSAERYYNHDERLEPRRAVRREEPSRREERHYRQPAAPQRPPAQRAAVRHSSRYSEDKSESMDPPAFVEFQRQHHIPKDPLEEKRKRDREEERMTETKKYAAPAAQSQHSDHHLRSYAPEHRMQRQPAPAHHYQEDRRGGDYRHEPEHHRQADDRYRNQRSEHRRYDDDEEYPRRSSLVEKREHMYQRKEREEPDAAQWRDNIQRERNEETEYRAERDKHSSHHSSSRRRYDDEEGDDQPEERQYHEDERPRSHAKRHHRSDDDEERDEKRYKETSNEDEEDEEREGGEAEERDEESERHHHKSHKPKHHAKTHHKKKKHNAHHKNQSAGDASLLEEKAEVVTPVKKPVQVQPVAPQRYMDADFMPDEAFVDHTPAQIAAAYNARLMAAQTDPQPLLFLQQTENTQFSVKSRVSAHKEPLFPNLPQVPTVLIN